MPAHTFKEWAMFAQDLHIPLAILTMLAVFVATLEGAVRAVRARPAGVAAERTRTAVVLAVAMTAAAGVALLVGGHHPKEWLHLIYATLAFSLVPVADNAGTMLQSDRGKGLARLGGGLVCLVVVTRLFATGSPS
jgi:hypothetical protein